MVKKIKCTVIRSVPLEGSRRRSCRVERPDYSAIVKSTNTGIDIAEDGPSRASSPYRHGRGIRYGLVLDFLA